MNYLKAFTLFLFLCIFKSLNAQTEIKSNITVDEIWTTEGSPYIIIGHIYLKESVSLTIERDVSIELRQGYLHLEDNSSLQIKSGSRLQFFNGEIVNLE